MAGERAIKCPSKADGIESRLRHYGQRRDLCSRYGEGGPEFFEWKDPIHPFGRTK